MILDVKITQEFGSGGRIFHLWVVVAVEVAEEVAVELATELVEVATGMGSYCIWSIGSGVVILAWWKMGKP